MTFEQWWSKYGPPELNDEYEEEDARECWDAATQAERERCIAIIQAYLQFDDQRAVSWHEVQDCIEKIRDK